MLNLEYYDKNFVFGEQFSSLNFSETFQYFPTHECWQIYAFIIKAKKNESKKYTLVTHNSDWSVGKALDVVGLTVDELPKNIYWFAQNVDVESPLIEAIPIGLENHHWHPKKREMLLEVINMAPKKYKYLCCALFNTSTNPRRKAIMEYFQQFDWCYCKETINGRGIEDYFEIIDNSMFCVCPEGNGIDTHRFWECSYLQTIPIVEDCINIRFFNKLPMLTFGSLLDVTKEDLIYTYEKEDFSYKILDMNYWKDKIYSKVYRENN